MEIIRTENLTIGYRSGKSDKIIMEDINLSLNKGELVCLLGRNAIGKTTLLRTIARLQSALKGNIFVENNLIEKLNIKDLAQYISIVLTERFFPEHLTVYELIALGRSPYTNLFGNLDEQDKKIIQQSINFIGLNEIADNIVNELSDGEKQKVLIARALTQDTSLIILDEPTAHLDIYNRLLIMSILKKLAKENNKAILLSTHDYDIAIHLANKMWLMTSEKIHIGVPEDLILNGLFKTIFQSVSQSVDEILFDELQGNFRIKNKGNQHINLIRQSTNDSLSQIENEVAFIWTKKALERNGYIIDSPEIHCPIKIEIILYNLPIKWGIQLFDKNFMANSIEELLRILENNR